MRKSNNLTPKNFLLLLALLFIGNTVTAQRFNSLVGVRAGYKTAAFSAKIALDEKNYLEGTMGLITPQPELTIGVGVGYHRHIPLNDSKDFQFYYGFHGNAVTGDVTTMGIGADAGLIFIYKSINIGIDVFPTYFFEEELGFKPLFGAHLRWVND